jgi:hypothetical protein
MAPGKSSTFKRALLRRASDHCTKPREEASHSLQADSRSRIGLTSLLHSPSGATGLECKRCSRHLRFPQPNPGVKCRCVNARLQSSLASQSGCWSAGAARTTMTLSQGGNETRRSLILALHDASQPGVERTSGSRRAGFVRVRSPRSIAWKTWAHQRSSHRQIEQSDQRNRNE